MKKGVTQLGVLWIIIGALLATSYVAMLVIRNSYDVTDQVYKVSGEKKQRVARSLKIILGEGFYDGEGIRRYYLKARLVPASYNINLSLTMLLLKIGTETETLFYNMSTGCNFTDNSSYGVEYLVKGDYYELGEVNDEDVIQICFVSDYYMYNRDKFIIEIIQQQGETLELDGRMPAIFNYEYVQFYP